MNDLDYLLNLKTLCIEQLAAIRATPKPTYKIDGQSVSWESYCRSLENSIDWCDRKMHDLQPFEVVSQGVT